MALFFTMLLDVGFQCFFCMGARMDGVAGCGVGMVSRRFVAPGLVMLGGFDMVAGGVSQVFRGFLVVFRGFLRHGALHG